MRNSKNKNKEKIISLSDLERILKDQPDILAKINKEVVSTEEQSKLKYIQSCIKRSIIQTKMNKLSDELDNLEEEAANIDDKLGLLVDDLYDNIENMDDDLPEKLENIAIKLANTHKQELTLKQISKFINLL